MQKNNSPLLFSFLILAFIIINTMTLKDGHNWGGDFSQYIHQAQNLVEGRQYSHTYDLSPWANYPPVFPLLLAPIIKFFDINYIALKLPNILYWLLFLLGLYPLMKKRLGSDNTLLITILLLSSPYFFLFKQNILSELPFIAFFYGAIYFFNKYFSKKKEEGGHDNSHLYLSLFLMLLCVFTRVIGIILLISSVFYIVINKKGKKPLIAALISTALCILFMIISKTSIESYVYEFNYIPVRQRLLNLDKNITYTFMQFILFLIPVKTTLTTSFFSIVNALLLKIIFYSSLTSILITFAYKSFKRSISFTECLFSIYLFSILIWAIESGARYILPIVGLALLFTVGNLDAFFKYLFDKIGRSSSTKSNICTQLILLGIIFHNVISIALIYDFDDNSINDPHVQEMTEWVQTNTAQNEHFMFMKPRVFGLLTERDTAAFMDHSADKDLLERVQKFNINYLVFIKSNNEVSFSILNEPTMSLKHLRAPKIFISKSGNLSFIDNFNLSKIMSKKPIWQNENFVIYKVL